MRHVTPSPPPTATFVFWLLGGLRVERAGKAVAIPGGKPLHLLAYLLLHADPERTRPALLTRDALIDHLWPELPASRARRTLSDTLYRLRRVLGDDWLYTDGDNLALIPNNLIWVDVWSFEHLISSTSTRDLEAAVALYTGDLLPEIYADWLLARRISLREAHQTAILHLAEQEEIHQRYPQSYSLYTQLAALDPLREDAHRGVMRTLARMHRFAEALVAYERLVDLLESELGVPPSAETKHLADLLHRERDQARAATHPARPLFVGRVEERARLVGRLDLARSGHGGLVVVMGEAGIGKTAMLNEMAQAAAWRNWQIYWGTHPVQTVPGQYSPLDYALRAALPTPRLQQIAHMVSPARLAPAAVLVPEIRRMLPPHVPADITTAPLEVADATEQVLRSLQRIAPHLLLLEDCTGTSTDFWSLLDHISHALAEMRLLLVLSARSDELRRHPIAWSMVTKWDRTGNASVLDLQGLKPAEMRALLAARGAIQPDEDELARLHRASGGNPLVALTTWETGIRSEHHLSVDDLAQRRVAALSPAARSALAGAAILGTEIDYPIWHTVWQRIVADTAGPPEAQPAANHAIAVGEESSLPTLAGELEAGHILQIRDDRYHFAHETLRVAAIHALAPSARRRWHRAALAAVAHHTPGDALRLYHHAVEAGEANAIVQHGIAAGNKSLTQFDYQNAVQFFTHALDSLSDAVADTHATRATSIQGCGESTAGDIDARRALELQYNARLGRSEAYGILGGLAWDAGDYTTAAERHGEAADLFHAEGDIVREAQALNNLGSTYWALGAYGQARETHERSLVACRAAGNRRSEADNIDNLGGVAWVLGDYDTAIKYYQEALSIRRAIDDTWGVAISLGNLGSAYRLRGDTEQALAYYEQSLPLYQEVGRRRSEAYVLHNRGATLLEMAQYEAALVALHAALEIRREIGDNNSIAETLALLALTHHENEAPDMAIETIGEALATLQTGSAPASLRREIHFHAYLVYRHTDEERAIRHLGLAQIALEELCAPLSAQDSRRLRENVPLNRRLRQAVDVHAVRKSMRLARIDAPLGRKLTDDEMTAVLWTIHAPQDCLLADDIQRRRAILQRLVTEAHEQGALPTDDDLAQALDVSRRTILRDIEALAAQGVSVATRSRN